MKRSVSAATAALLAMALAACGQSSDKTEASAADAERNSVVSGSSTPAFAVSYPGGIAGSSVSATAASAGAGGLSSFTTTDAPEKVIAFYKSRAERSGLAQVSNMSQGDTKAYAASSPSGAELQVVATPVDGQTSVQVTWNAGS